MALHRMIRLDNPHNKGKRDTHQYSRLQQPASRRIHAAGPRVGDRTAPLAYREHCRADTVRHRRRRRGKGRHSRARVSVLLGSKDGHAEGSEDASEERGAKAEGRTALQVRAISHHGSQRSHRLEFFLEGWVVAKALGIAGEAFLCEAANLRIRRGGRGVFGNAGSDVTLVHCREIIDGAVGG